MGREVRRVPPPEVWLHPTDAHGDHKPLCDWCYCEFVAMWESDDPEEREPEPPAPDDPVYRPHFPPDERTWWQVYETVSEGAPVTPPFPTREALRAWLLAYGDRWEQMRARRDRRAVNLPTPHGVDALLRGGPVPSLMARGGTLVDAYGSDVQRT